MFSIAISVLLNYSIMEEPRFVVNFNRRGCEYAIDVLTSDGLPFSEAWRTNVGVEFKL